MTSKRKRSNPVQLDHASAEEDILSGDEEGLPTSMSQTQFSQVPPDRSQTIDLAKPSEVEKLEKFNPAARDKIVTDLSRILLFKGLSGETIDRRKVVAEALGDVTKERVQQAALNEAENRLRDVFGFSIRRVTQKMEEVLPAKFKDRLYLINDVEDDQAGTHSINLHSSHVDSSIEKGVLMIVLAFAFCKGAPSRSGTMKGAGKSTRWITEHQLYNLLHRVDENIPSEPPSQEWRKKSAMGRGRLSLDHGGPGDGGVAQTPDIDSLLERFVSMDYLLRDKIEEVEAGRESQLGEDGTVLAYAMGPRAAMEIGRKQIVYFCSQILDEQPDPTMLAEIEEDDEEYYDDPDASEEEPETKPHRTNRTKRSA